MADPGANPYALAPMSAPRTVLTIGTFDGVHRGHIALVARAREQAGPEGSVIALVFDPHPMSQLAPDRTPPRLTGFDQRQALLRSIGVDRVVRLAPTRERLGQEPEAFVRWIVEGFAPDAIVEGRDFRFGRGRAGDLGVLAALGDHMGFRVIGLEPVEATLSDHSIVTASSTIVRWLIAHGRVADAGRVLGRPYELVGTVVQGDRRGREIGFPTANLACEMLAPADGVYAGEAILPDGRSFVAAISVGTKPQFNGSDRTIEAHLLDAPREGCNPAIVGLDEYGWTLRVRTGAWIRDQARFDSLDALVEQIGRDCARIAQIMADGPFACAGTVMMQEPKPTREVRPCP